LAVQGSLRVLQLSILRFFGTISYTLYLVHQSALVLLHYVIRHRVPSAFGGRAILASVTALAVSVAACWMSWLYFEKPMLSWALGRFVTREQHRRIAGELDDEYGTLRPIADLATQLRESIRCGSYRRYF